MSTERGSHPITVERIRQADGAYKYAVRQAGACMSRSGDWSYEPMASNRDENFIREHRFDSWQEASAAILRHCETV